MFWMCLDCYCDDITDDMDRCPHCGGADIVDENGTKKTGRE